MQKLKSIPIVVQNSSPVTENIITVEDLKEQLVAAKKGRAKVDVKYVNNASGLSHLYEYSYDWALFLKSIESILEDV